MKKLSPILLLLCLPLLLNNFLLEASWWPFSQRRANRKTYSEKMLTPQQAFDYANLCVKSLSEALPKHLRSAPESQSATKDLLHGMLYPQEFMLNPNNGKLEKDKVDQAINGALLEIIKNISYNEAFNATRNKQAAENISDAMENKALKAIGQDLTFEPEKIANFFGADLNGAIENTLKDSRSQQYRTPIASVHQTVRPSAPPVEQAMAAKVYYRTNCPVCLDKFERETIRRILSCGHSICTSCAPQISDRLCPECRQKTI